MPSTTSISAVLVPEDQRIDHTAKLFGVHFPMQLEPTIFNIAGNLASDYNGGFWEFYELENGGFYMAPSSDAPFKVICENGFNGNLSAEAFGVVCCLYAYSHLSFGDGAFAQVCAEHYHLLRAFMLDHPEAGDILRSID